MKEITRTTLSDMVRHRTNPVVIMCRLIDMGFSMPHARRLAAWYETKIYRRTPLGA